MTLQLLAYLTIFVCSTWCVMSPKVQDGILGKLVFITASLCSFAPLLNFLAGARISPLYDRMLVLCMAGLAIRNVWISRVLPRLGLDRRRDAPPSPIVQNRRWHP